jgi:hypothetical protein
MKTSKAKRSKESAEKPWPPENVMHAFDKVLNRSAHDRTFRNRLTASLESAKKAVSDEGEINIPKDVVIVFHENRYNEKYLVFWLPEFDEKTRTTHTAKYHFECCYSAWMKRNLLRASRTAGKS